MNEEQCLSCDFFVMREIQRCSHPKRLMKGMFEAPCQTKATDCKFYRSYSLVNMVKNALKDT